MKKNINYVDAALIDGVLTELGLIPQVQKGFRKYALGPKGRTLYVANTARVGRIDISGFETPKDWVGIKRLGGEAFGNVKEQVDFTCPPETILNTLRAVVEHGASLPDRVEEKKGTAKASTTGVKPKGWMTQEERMELIMKVAVEKGVLVSPNASSPTSSPEATEEPAQVAADAS